MRARRASLMVATLCLVLAAEPVLAGACVCVKRNMENKVIEFTCVELAGENGGAAGCSNHCKGAGYNGYDWLVNETCNGLYERFQDQKVKIRIKNIQIGPVGIEIDQAQELSSVNTSAAGQTLAGTAIVAPAPRPILTGTATIEAFYDTFDVPDTLGGGTHTTTAFSGTLKLRLEPMRDPNKYKVLVTEVNTIVQPMIVNGFNSGLIFGSLNPLAPNEGELDTATGQIDFLFSQFLYPQDFPGIEMHTWSYYYGTCNNCLNGGDAILDADSFFISPVP